MATKPKLAANPTVDAAAKTWTKGFAAAIRSAAGDSKTLTASKVAKMTGPFADNARNFFERTGRKSASVEVVIDSGARYVRSASTAAAGADGKLSLKDMEKLPGDLVTDMLWMRGKVEPEASSTSAALTKALEAMDIPEIADYGKHVSVTSYPSNTSLADVLRQETNWDGFTDAEMIKEFKGTKGDAAAREFQADMNEVGSQERENADDDASGRKLERLFKNFGAAAVADFTPASKFASLEYGVHGISEDGDTEYRLLVAKEKTGAWKVLQYQDFPF